MISSVAYVAMHSSPLLQPGVGDAGGMNVYLDRLCRTMVARDVDVTVFTRRAIPDIATVVEVMTRLNRDAKDAALVARANAATDVTGFGLMGHLRSMVRASGVGATVEFSKIPLLPGAWELLEEGIAPGGTHRNLDSVAGSVQWHPELTGDQKIMLCDAQTSGGLLISVTQAKLPDLLSRLDAAGVATRAVVGNITQGPKGEILATP